MNTTDNLLYLHYIILYYTLYNIIYYIYIYIIYIYYIYIYIYIYILYYIIWYIIYYIILVGRGLRILYLSKLPPSTVITSPFLTPLLFAPLSFGNQLISCLKKHLFSLAYNTLNSSSALIYFPPLPTGQLCTSTHEEAPENTPISLVLLRLYKTFIWLHYFYFYFTLLKIFGIGFTFCLEWRLLSGVYDFLRFIQLVKTIYFIFKYLYSVRYSDCLFRDVMIVAGRQKALTS